MYERISITDKRPKGKSQSKLPQIQRKKNHAKSMNSPVDQILFLQRTAGNQAVQRLIKSGALQAKLRIGQPGDIYEQEADRVAEQVMRMPESPTLFSGTSNIHSIQRECPGCEDEELKRQPIEEEEEEELRRQPIEEEKEEELQTKATSGGISEVNPEIESHIQNIQGAGHPLPESTRAFFEPRFGTDFIQVRVHTDAKAAESAREVNARAYTVGPDIVFGVGEYAPGKSEGQRLLGHELTHVMQQNNEGIRMIQKAEVDDNPAFCFPGSGGITLQDISGNINQWIAGASRIAEANAIHIVNAIYRDLGCCGVRSRVEERIAALPRTHVRHVQPSESRYRGQQWYPSIAAQSRTRRLAPVVNLCNVCVGADKIGHFFAQGYEYFRIGQLLRQRIRSMNREERERFRRNITPPLPESIPGLIEEFPSESIRLRLPEEFREDQLVEIYTNEFGKWLEGFEHRLPPEEVRWIRGLDFIRWYYSEGVYGRSFSGVLSRADLAANASGGRFYIDMWRNPAQSPNICYYVDAAWNEHHNLSTFVETPTPAGPRSRSEIAEEP
jgi:hypothetical protein